VIVAGNLANISFFFAGIPGPEQFLAGHPMLVVTVVFCQIVTMLVSSTTRFEGAFGEHDDKHLLRQRPRRC
jgi:hypothetical protein